MPTTPNPGSSWPPAPPSPPGPSGPLGPRSGQRPLLPEDAQVLGERLRLFLLVTLGLLVVAQLSLPFRLAGILLGVLAGWVGIRLLVRMARLRRAGFRTRGSILVSVGLGLSAVLMFTLVAEAAYYPLAAQLERCRSGANTQTAADACQQAARARINNMVDRLDQP